MEICSLSRSNDQRTNLSQILYKIYQTHECDCLLYIYIYIDAKVLVYFFSLNTKKSEYYNGFCSQVTTTNTHDSSSHFVFILYAVE